MRKKLSEIVAPKPGEPVRADLIAALVEAARDRGVPSLRESFEDETSAPARRALKAKPAWFPATVEGEDTIPIYSVVMVSGASVDDQGQLSFVVKPFDGDPDAVLAVNENYELNAESGGHVRIVAHGEIVLATRSASLIFNDKCGPEEDEITVGNGRGMTYIAEASEYGTNVAYFTHTTALQRVPYRLQHQDYHDSLAVDEFVPASRIDLGTFDVPASGDDAIIELYSSPFFIGCLFGYGSWTDNTPYDSGSHDPVVPYLADNVDAFKLGDRWYGIGMGRVSHWFVMKDSLYDDAGGSPMAWRIDAHPTSAPETYPIYEIGPRDGFCGVAFGADDSSDPTTPITPPNAYVCCTWMKGEGVLARVPAPGWIAEGPGALFVRGTISALDALNETATVNNITIPIGLHADTEVQTLNNASFDSLNVGDEVDLVWARQIQFVPVGKGSAEISCGLKLNDDEEIEVDPVDLAGCGLKPVDAETTCQLEIDPEALAGEGLDVAGGEGCAIRLSQDIIDRIVDLEECCATLTTIVNNHETRITELELCCLYMQQCCEYNTACCEYNKQKIYDCCYGREEMDLVYNVQCIDGNIIIETRCVNVEPCGA